MSRTTRNKRLTCRVKPHQETNDYAEKKFNNKDRTNTLRRRDDRLISRDPELETGGDITYRKEGDIDYDYT